MRVGADHHWMDHVTLIMGCKLETSIWVQRLTWGTIVYSTLDNLTKFIVLSHFLFILIIPSSLFIDKIVLDLLRLYVWLYFSFVFFSSVSPPGPQGGNTAAWPVFTSILKRKNVLLGSFSVLGYDFGQQLWDFCSLFMFSLCFFK